MTTAEALVSQWAARATDRDKKLTVQRLADRLDRSHKMITGFGSKTFLFADGSKLYVSGRGKYYRLRIIGEQQAA